MEPLTGCRLWRLVAVSSGAAQRLGTRTPGSLNPWRLDPLLQLMESLSTEDVSAVAEEFIAMLSTSDDSLDLSPGQLAPSRVLPGERGAFAALCFSISRSSCMTVLLLLLLLVGFLAEWTTDFGG